MSKKRAIDILNRAKNAKDDEFYTMYEDIESEMTWYKPYFIGRSVYCNCDNPEFSNFWKYFYNNFHELKLKMLYATYFEPVQDGVAHRYVYNGCCYEIEEYFGTGSFDDFENELLLDKVDVVVSNPPFSLFNKYVDFLFRNNTDFIILGNQLGSQYKCFRGRYERMYMSFNERTKSSSMKFSRPDGSVAEVNCKWFSTVKSTKPLRKLKITEKFDKSKYKVYDNYDAIEVPNLLSIPVDYYDVMGVPTTVLTGYDLSEFDIIDYGYKLLKIDNINLFSRVIIQRRRD